jgi:YYY domain-containing protein
VRVGNLCPPPATETINEFPFFSLLLGDLHPHLMALPFTIAALALALNLALLPCRQLRQGERWAALALTGVFVGSLYLMNAWDYPTALLLVLIGVGFGSGRNFATAWKPAAMLIVASVVAWLPFWLTYVPPTQSLNLYGSEVLARLPILNKIAGTLAFNSIDYTSVGEYLTIFGVGYVVAVVTLIAGILGIDETERRTQLRTGLYATALTVPFAIVVGAPVVPLCGVPLAFALHQLVRCRTAVPRTVALVLFSVAWVMSIVVEFVYVRDVFNDRMNTLFKFYYQTWTLYAIGSGVGVIVLWRAAPRWSWQRVALAGAGALAILAGVAYPAVASYQWTDHFAAWQGLDGLDYAFAEEGNDVAAIRWLEQHAQSGDVVLEAAGCSYRPFNRLPYNRVSAFTGVPTVIGWGDNHQRQWRSGEPALLASIPRRQDDVAAMYANPQSPLVREYGVRWLFVGEYETGTGDPDCRTAGPYAGVDASGYPGPGWEEAFSSGPTRIYRQTSFPP